MRDQGVTAASASRMMNLRSAGTGPPHDMGVASSCMQTSVRLFHMTH